ncbi:MAG: hypothetical protein WC565_06825 [Parcubacteria group bacterium]
MGALPYIVGGGVVLLVVAAATKAKASTSTSTTTKPTGSTTSTTTKPTSTTATTGVAAPAYLESVPYVIAMRVIQLSDPSLQQAQGVWLTDNGYPLTGEAVQKYSRGEITDLQLRQIAQAEFKAGAVATTPTVTITPKPKGTTAPDTYGTYLLNAGTDDEIYSYALTSPSIPFVTQAAARLAAAGDSRALAVTQHLADIST